MAAIFAPVMMIVILAVIFFLAWREANKDKDK